MTNCRLCGHESHCGGILKKDLEGGGEEIQVCYFMRGGFRIEDTKCESKR